MTQNFSIHEWETSVPIDDSTDSYQYFRYVPNVGANQPNEPGEIIFSNESQNKFTHPHNSYLYFKGKLSTAVGIGVGGNDFNFPENERITLVNNGLMFLFDRIRYKLGGGGGGGQDIENIQDPGQATTMLGLLKYPDDYSRSFGLNRCWLKDEGTGTLANDSGNTGGLKRRNYILEDEGNFSFCIPLFHIFGFCEDYNKTIYGVNHELILTRPNNNGLFVQACSPIYYSFQIIICSVDKCHASALNALILILVIQLHFPKYRHSQVV